MTRTLARLALLLAALLLLAACGDPRTANDPYADPGTAAPATIADPTIAPAGSVAPRADGSGLVDVNVAGFAAPAALAAAALGTVDSLPPSAFTVVEDGVVKGITVERIGSGDTRAGADVVFVFDTTGSMGVALGGVQESIIGFVDYLEEGGLDVHVGVVTFGDAYDTQAATGTRGTSLRGDTPPMLDYQERPTLDLSADFEAFRDFIAGDSERGGGDVPENGVGALAFAYDELAWRAGAQKIMIFITDTCQHSDVTYAAVFGGQAGYEGWAPPAPADLLARLRGNATVHVIAPDARDDYYCGADHVYMDDFTGVDGTGGVFVEWDMDAEFDLTALPLAAASRGGYVLTYRGTAGGEPKTVRVVIDDGGNVRGEFTIAGDY